MGDATRRRVDRNRIVRSTSKEKMQRLPRGLLGKEVWPSVGRPHRVKEMEQVVAIEKLEREALSGK